MSQIKYFSFKSNIEKKTIILRLDLNVPLKDKKIQDDTRILLIIPFLKKLLEKKAKILIISHLGRPSENKKSGLSLMPIFNHLKDVFGKQIEFYNGDFNSELSKKLSEASSSKIILTENIRFFNEEMKDDINFAKKIAALGDMYINDAFSCSHRKQASVHALPSLFRESYAGPLFQREVDAIDSVISKNRHPVTCIIGGSKISTKIGVILNLVKKVDNIVIVGAMANNFLRNKGLNIGNSLVEKNTREIVDKIFNALADSKCNLILPNDFGVSRSFNGNKTQKDSSSINSDEIILDIGPKTIDQIKETIENSMTVLWNGPAGYFENKEFATGTNEIAKNLLSNTKRKSLISILGGGDTISAIKKINENLLFTHLSTAGGAFLDYLEGKDLPGVSVLK